MQFNHQENSANALSLWHIARDCLLDYFKSGIIVMDPGTYSVPQSVKLPPLGLAFH